MALTTYRSDNGIGIITMDDGKVNALSPAMQAEINVGLDAAERDGAVAVLCGRPDLFSGGFDLGVIRAGGAEATGMVRGGFELAERMLSFPFPVVIACTGHAIAMGLFVVLSGDHRIGAAGPFKLVANEVAIGMTMPRAAIEITQQRVAPAHVNRVLINAEVYDPEHAVDAGLLDRLAPPDDLVEAAITTARGLAALDMTAHAATKRRTRHATLAALRAAIENEDLTLPAPS